MTAQLQFIACAPLCADDFEFSICAAATSRLIYAGGRSSRNNPFPRMNSGTSCICARNNFEHRPHFYIILAALNCLVRVALPVIPTGVQTLNCFIPREITRHVRESTLRALYNVCDSRCFCCESLVHNQFVSSEQTALSLIRPILRTSFTLSSLGTCELVMLKTRVTAEHTECESPGEVVLSGALGD